MPKPSGKNNLLPPLVGIKRNFTKKIWGEDTNRPKEKELANMSKVNDKFG